MEYWLSETLDDQVMCWFCFYSLRWGHYRQWKYILCKLVMQALTLNPEQGWTALLYSWNDFISFYVFQFPFHFRCLCFRFISVFRHFSVFISVSINGFIIFLL